MRGPFGKHLQALLDARRWTQTDLADRLGIPSGSISRLITGTRRPQMSDMIEWAVKLGLSPDETRELERAAALERAPEVLREMIAQLRRHGADQDRRIAELEAQVSALKDAIAGR